MWSPVGLCMPAGHALQYDELVWCPLPSLSDDVRVVKCPAEQDSQLESATVLYLPNGQSLH
jgi:hypothetical protein